MISIHKSALTQYSAKQMFDLVVDIPAYPEFLQWCNGSEVLSKSDDEVVARVDINYKGIQQSFTTSNKNSEAESIDMQLYDTSGPFEYFAGCWSFTDLSQGDVTGSKVEFKLDFTTQSKVLSGVFKSVFSQIVNSQVEGFVKRAEQLYTNS